MSTSVHPFDPRDPESLPRLVSTTRSLLEGPNTRISVMANVASLLYWSLPDVNWAGFYLLEGEALLLGPFHGKPACVHIPLSRGVCGKAARERRTVRVDDVEAFEDHIACDADSRSEIVVPLLRDGALLGVLDVDSPVHARFSPAEERVLEDIAALVAGWEPSGSGL